MATTRERGRTAPDERGAAAVELALLLPVLLTIALAIFAFGLGYSAKLTLNAGVREGARTLALGGTDADAVSQVQRLAVKLNPPLATSDVSIDGRCPAGDTTSKARISAVYRVPYNLVVVHGTWNITASSVMRCGV